MRPIRPFTILAMASTLSLTALSAAAGTLYFSEDNNFNGLYTLDTTTGAATALGETEVTANTVGLAPTDDPAGLVGSTWTEITAINSDGSGATTIPGTPSAEGLAYDADTDTVYGTINRSFFSYSSDFLSTTTLASPNADIEGLAWGGGSTIFGLAGFGGPRGHLFSYDIVSDVWSFIGDTGIDFNLVGLAYNPEDDVLYAKGSQDSYLYAIDPTSASASIIGDTQLQNGGGLAYVSDVAPIPVPGALFLLGSGLLGLGAMRRRKQPSA